VSAFALCVVCVACLCVPVFVSMWGVCVLVRLSVWYVCVSRVCVAYVFVRARVCACDVCLCRVCACCVCLVRKWCVHVRDCLLLYVSVQMCVWCLSFSCVSVRVSGM
jgi:hypothetical protein